MTTEKREVLNPLDWTHAEGMGGWASSRWGGGPSGGDVLSPDPPAQPGTRPASFGEMICKTTTLIFHCVCLLPA